MFFGTFHQQPLADFFRGKEAQLLAEDLRQGCGLVQRSSRRWRFYVLLPGVLHIYICMYMCRISTNYYDNIYILYVYLYQIVVHILSYIYVCVYAPK